MGRSGGLRSVSEDTGKQGMRFSRGAPTKMPYQPLFQGSFKSQIVFVGIDVRIIVVFARRHKANLISMADEEIPGTLIPPELVKSGKQGPADDDRMGALPSHFQCPQGTPALQISGEKMIDDS